jgi:hypothetical protein
VDKMAIISLEVSLKNLKKLEIIADAMEMSKGRLIQYIVDEWIDDLESITEILNEKEKEESK